MATLQEKIDYNRRKAAKHGWGPEWFDCTDFDADLIIAIKAYQSRNGLSMDGMCGPSTFRVIYTEREQDNDLDDGETENGETENGNLDTSNGNGKGNGGNGGNGGN